MLTYCSNAKKSKTAAIGLKASASEIFRQTAYNFIMSRSSVHRIFNVTYVRREIPTAHMLLTRNLKFSQTNSRLFVSMYKGLSVIS
jgi:hypothetical protein